MQIGDQYSGQRVLSPMSANDVLCSPCLECCKGSGDVVSIWITSKLSVGRQREQPFLLDERAHSPGCVSDPGTVSVQTRQVDIQQQVAGTGPHILSLKSGYFYIKLPSYTEGRETHFFKFIGGWFWEMVATIFFRGPARCSEPDYYCPSQGRVDNYLFSPEFRHGSLLLDSSINTDMLARHNLKIMRWSHSSPLCVLFEHDKPLSSSPFCPLLSGWPRNAAAHSKWNLAWRQNYWGFSEHQPRQIASGMINCRTAHSPASNSRCLGCLVY